MAKKSMTIVEVKEAKITMEAAVVDLLNTFEEDTGTKIQYMNKTRKRDRDEKDAKCCCSPCVPYNSDRGPIVDVTFELELDLD